ncbi:MAG TPA: alpha/beta fold hydrolase [Gemmatimonadota bacterium]|nr:alpha/beta fold hydrolase [Gemmatimonadota bacterium]
MSDRVTFPGASGSALAARIERPADEPVAWALFAHCFTCSKDLRAAREITRTLADHGIAVLRFDFTGLGESEGDFADTDFSSNVEDLVAAADWLRAEHGPPRLLVGHSLGGAAVLVAAGLIVETAAVATIGAPAGTEHLRGALLREAPELEGTEEARIELAGRPFRIKRRLLEDLADQNLEAAIAGLGKPLLVLHAPDDEIVPVEDGRRIFGIAKDPKAFVSLDGADHLLTDAGDAVFAGEILAAWADRYVADGERPRGRVGVEPAAHRGEVVLLGRRGYAVEILTYGHRLVADEPEEKGGTDRGPSPYDLLLAALGACKAITVRMYADRKGWPLLRTIYRLDHDRIHAEDCADCETKEGRIDEIRAELQFVGPLSEGQRERLLEIADKCPVHRTLTGEVKIRSRLKEG